MHDTNNLLGLLLNAAEETPGQRLARVTITNDNPMPTVVKKMSGPGMQGMSISSGGSSSSYSTTLPIKTSGLAKLARAYYSLS
jgi:hypothetical protein